jgi:hypothetical protein
VTPPDADVAPLDAAGLVAGAVVVLGGAALVAGGAALVLLLPLLHAAAPRTAAASGTARIHP